MASTKSDLDTALEESERLVAETLKGARKELAELNERKTFLEDLISRAEAFQRSQGSQHPKSERLTLHAAISRVLSEEDNRWMSARELTDIINARALYRKKDGSKIELSQVHARTKNYANLFEKDGPSIRLRADKEGASS